MKRPALPTYLLAVAVSLFLILLALILFLPLPILREQSRSLLAAALLLCLLICLFVWLLVRRSQNKQRETILPLRESLRELEQEKNELEQRSAELLAMIQSMQEGVIALDEEGKVSLLSEHAAHLLGTAAWEEKQKKPLGLLGQNYARLAMLIKEHAEPDQAITLEFETTQPQDRIIKLYFSPINAEQHSGLLLVLQDVTRLKQLEALRRDFASNVTHELKTPLTSINGYIELLQSSERSPELRRNFYEIIKMETDRLICLIQDLLQIAELEQWKNQALQSAYLGTCDFAEVAAHVIKQCGPMAEEKEITLLMDVPEPFMLPGRGDKQEQLLTNLLSNAILYNNPGGYVRISAGWERDKRYCRVKDNGIGIAREDQERIFERFYRVHKERSRSLGGTGLGLAIVKHMVQLFGGTLALSSEPGKGSTFTIYYPMDSPSAQN